MYNSSPSKHGNYIILLCTFLQGRAALTPTHVTWRGAPPLILIWFMTPGTKPNPPKLLQWEPKMSTVQEQRPLEKCVYVVTIVMHQCIEQSFSLIYDSRYQPQPTSVKAR